MSTHLPAVNGRFFLQLFARKEGLNFLRPLAAIGHLN